MITASAAGLLSHVGSLPYSVTKSAAVSVAEWLAISHEAEGLRVHCLCPEAVRTRMIPLGSDGGFAGLDGILAPGVVAKDVLVAMSKGQFLILPHKQVSKYIVHKATDIDRWLGGMRKLHTQYGDAVKFMPPASKL